MKVQNRKGVFPMFLWAGFWMTLLLPLLFCLLVPNPVSASTVASGITTNAATVSTHMRKSFYANGRYWVFYSDATNMVYKTSLDGISWSLPTTVRAADSGNRFSVFFDGTYLHYAYCAETANTPIYYRRGTPNSNGTITWSAAEQTALAAVATDTYNGPNISVATDGRAWIGYELYTTTGPARSPYVTRNNNTDGTWSVASGFPYQLRSQMGSIGNGHCVQPVPLTTGYVFAIYGATGFTLRGKRWNGSWGTEKATTNAVLGSNGYSAVNEGDDVHLCFVTGSNPDTVIYAKYTYASDSFGGETTIQSSPNGGLPAVSLNTTTNTLYCFWRNYNNGTHIYYKKKTQAGSWDSTATDWIDESTDGLTASDRLTAFYKDYGGKIGLVYMTETSNPYKVRFERINAKAGQREPLLVYSQNGDPDIYYSRYTSGNWGTGAVAADLGTTPRNYWKVAKTHPSGSSQAVVSVKSDAGLYATFFDGASWSSPADLGVIHTADYRCFDAAYEQRSGQLLIVAGSTNPGYIRYWVWDGSSWVVNGASQSISSVTSNQVNWARLSSKPGSNEIALIFADDGNSSMNRKAGALIWNGDNNSWGNIQQLTNDLSYDWNLTEETISENIGVEYMLAGVNAGKALFAWAENNFIKGQVWNGTSYDTVQSLSVSATIIRWVRLKADPNSDDMVIGFEEENSSWKYVYAHTWTGTTWGGGGATTMTTAGDGSAKYNRCFDVVYEGDAGSHNGHIVFVYSQSSYLRYKHYDGSSWSTAQYVDAGSFTAYWVQLQRAPDNTVYLAIHESADDLNTWTWNNTSWTAKNEVSTGLEMTVSVDERVEVIYLANMPLVVSAAPVITSLDYNWGSVGASITITGYNFGYSQGSSTLTFYNNKAATVTSWDNTQIVVTVPLGATTGNITLTTSGGSDTESFTVITGAPTVTTILPDEGSNFSDIDIAYVTGTNLSPGLTITLTKASQTDILGTGTAVSSATTISTSAFDLTSKTTGLWNVVVLNPDDQSVTGSNLFAIHPPVTVTSGANATYNDIHYPNQKHLVRDSAGNWYYVYSDGSDLYMTRCTSGSTTWDSPTKLTGTSGIITTWQPQWNDLSMDIYRTGNVSNDRIHLVWRVSTDSTAGKYILYSKCNDLTNYNQTASWTQVDGGTTTRYDQLDSTAFVSQYIKYVDVAVDSGGYPHVTWHYSYIGNYNIRYITTRTGTGGDWGSLQLPVTDSSDSGYTTIAYGYPSVDTNSSNAVHISYTQYKTSISREMVRHMTASGPNYNSWTKTDVVSDSSRTFYESSLVIDSNDRVYVVAKDDTNRDLFWAYYNGSTWSTNNNLTNGSFDVESAVVGAKMGGGITDHILLSKVYDASSNKKVIYWRWEYSTSNWSKYSEELDTGNESRSYVSIEKHAPASVKTMGYLFYDTSGDTLYFDQFTDLGSNPTGGAYKMEKQVEMQVVQDSTASTTYYDTDNQQFFYYQSGNYDTPGTVSKFYFEAVIRASSGATAYAALYTAGGSYVTDTEITTTSASFTRVRSGEITLTNNTEYRVRIKTSSGGTGYLRNARIVVLQSSADRITKTETHALISGYNEYMEGSGGCCYVEPTYYSPHRFYLDKTNFSGTVSAYFEAIVGVTGGTGYVRLYDTDGTAYGDQLTTTSSSPTRVGGVGSTNIWSSLTSGKTYTLRVKVSEDEYSMYVYGAKLILVQSDATNITKTESYYHLDIMGQSYSDASYTQTYNYNQFNPGNWGPNTPTYYFEAINARNGIQAITGYMQLYNYTDTSEITSFSMIPVQAPPTRTRSSAITMPSATKTLELREYKTGGSSGLYVVASRVIVQSNHAPTVVKLKSFEARGNGKHVKVDWETASETNNLGFNLYRSTKKEGSYTKLNTSLIPGLLSSPTGRKYTYDDKKVTKGKLYYYKLEDIDLSGKRTMHGPVCVDWNGDGIADDQQSRKKSSGLSSGSSGRRPVMENSRVNSPYAEGSRVIGPDTNSFTARQKEDRVLLQWRSGHEVNTLGYHVYREENGELLRITPELVAGSALFAGNALPAGYPYAWWDILATEGREAFSVGRSAFDVKYWLEEISLDGNRSWCGPVIPVPDQTLKIPEHVVSALLSKVGMNPSGQQNLGSRTTVPPSQRLSAPGPIELQWNLAAGSAIKLFVRERGWYRVTQPELVAAGLDPRAKPRFLQLFVDGLEQPIRVRGQNDGRFGKNDFIEFYGEALDTLSSDIRTYWLVVGQTPGKRISNVRSSQGLEDHSSISFTVQLKERSLYFQALHNGEDDNFFGPTIGTTPVERTLNIPYPDPTYPGDATLTVSLQGVTLKPHRVQVLLNNITVGELVFDGKTHEQATMTVPHSSLLEGDNLITLVAQGQDLDISLLDTVELSYQRALTADAEELGLTLSNPGRVRIEGFTSHPIQVADVTDPGAVKLVSGASVGRSSFGYSVRFGSNRDSGNRTFYAFSEAGIKTPAEIRANQVSTWHQEDQGADLVVISHRNFMESLAALKTHRESQGLSVALIDIEDIYDEFSYGTKTPQAIKDFLTRASTSWQTHPRFVLLVGDASFDPKNYLNLGNQDFVPTKILDTEYMETASDDWFVDFNNDGLPDMAIGRLPVQTAEEAATVVSKIIAYDQAPSGDWVTEALMVADLNDTYDFEGASQEVSDLLPESITIWSVYRGQAGDAAARTAILGSINEGKLIVNYIGHGTVDLWRGSLLTASDADSLTNGAALSFVVAMTCLNGFFQTPYMESLAEALLKTETGGAVAVWTSSGLTVPNEQAPMNQELVRLLFNGQGLTLGEAVAQAKAATDDMDVRRSWILFGDPTTRLKP